MIRIAQTEDIDRLNEIANHSAVFPFIAQDKNPIDLTKAFELHRTYISEFGAIMFYNTGGGTYSFHTMFLPEGRGRHALKVAKHAAQDMFTATNAMELVTLTPDNAPHARPPLTFGFRPWFQSKHGQMFRLNVHDWIMKARACREMGEVFHDKLHEMKAELDAEEHEDDAVHDHYVGASCLMSLAGNVDKALMIYNSWAACAGYAPAFVIERSPLRVDTGDAIWTIANGNLEIEQCQ